jgi:hypothetical protein
MFDAPREPATLEAALERLTETVRSWNPDDNADVAPLLEALRELQLRFDPRSDRLSASLCVTCMKLLEEVADRGQVRPEAAVAVVGELSLGLKESLKGSATVTAARGGLRQAMVTLEAPKTQTGTGLSLAVGGVKNQTIGELMKRMNMLSHEQVEHVLDVQSKSQPRKLFGEVAMELGYASEWTVDNALRLQARGRGEAPPTRDDGTDPWGGSPL